MIGYKILGFVVWRAIKWYLRQRFSSRRLVITAAVVIFTGLAALTRFVRRLAG